MTVLRNKTIRGLLFLLLQGTAGAASLKPETANAWDAYVQAATDHMQQRLHPGHHFLWIDEDQERLASVQSGETYISSVGEQNPKKVPSGLIHDWIGAVFIPDSKIEDVLSRLRDYKHYKEFYHPGVADSKTLASEGAKDRFSVVLMNKVLVAKKALDSDCEATYFRIDDKHWYSISRSTRMQEVENYGAETQHELPQDVGTGLIWRLMSISRFEERDGGVYMELEAIALSRDIPMTIHWLVAPIVRHASRSSLALSLEQTQKAVHPETESAKTSGSNTDLLERGFQAFLK